jgi:hypothetical protein
MAQHEDDRDVRQMNLLSYKVAQSSDSRRPPHPAWCALPCGNVAAACLAEPCDIVLADTHFFRYGRIIMPEVAVAIAPLRRGEFGALLVALRDGSAVVADAHPDRVAPMRKKAAALALAAEKAAAATVLEDPSEGPAEEAAQDPAPAPPADVAAQPTRREEALSVADRPVRCDAAPPAVDVDSNSPLSVSPSSLAANQQQQQQQQQQRQQKLQQQSQQHQQPSLSAAPPANPHELTRLVSPPPLYSGSPGPYPTCAAVAETSPPVAIVAYDDGRIYAWLLPDHDEPFTTPLVPSYCLFGMEGPFSCPVLSLSVVSVPNSGDSVAAICFVRDSGPAYVVHVDAVALRQAYAGSLGTAVVSKFQSLSDVQCDYGRVLAVVWADDRCDRVVFSGEDDGTYCSMLGGTVGVTVALHTRQCQRPTANRVALGRHESYVSGVAVRDGFMVSAGWDGRLVLRKVAGMESGTPANVQVSCAAARYSRLVGENDDEHLLFQTTPGKTLWRVEWPLPGVLYVSSRELSGRCIIHRILLSCGEDSDDDEDRE